MEVNSQNNLEKEEQSRRNILTDFKNSYKVIVIKTVWYCHDGRHIDLWNRTECPEVNPHIYGQFIINKHSATIEWRKIILTAGVGTIAYPHAIERRWTPTQHHIQISTQNVSETQI